MPTSGQIYDEFIGHLIPGYDPRGDISYTVDNGVYEYPSADAINVMGPLYLPRIYGKDLSSFEIASSGKIALSIRDVHSIDLDRDSALSNITLSTLCNDTFIISTNNSNMTMIFDANKKDIDLYAASNVNITASNDIIMNAMTGKIDMNTGAINYTVTGNFGYQAGASSVQSASNDVEITAVSGAMYLSATGSNENIMMQNHNIVVKANSNVDVVAGDNITILANSNVFMTGMTASIILAAHNSNVTFAMDHVTDNASLYAASNVSVAASNDMSLVSFSDIYVEARTGGFTVVSHNSNMVLDMNEGTNTIMVASSNDIKTTACNNVVIEAMTGSATIYAAGGQATISMDAPTTSINAFAANNFTLTASSNILMNAEKTSFIMAAADSNVKITMDAPTQTLSLYATSNVNITASNNMSTYVVGSSILSTGSDIYMLAANSNVYMNMVDATNDMVIYAANDVKTSSSHSTFISSIGDIIIAADCDVVSVSLTHNTATTAAPHIYMNATNNIVSTASTIAKMQIDGGATYFDIQSSDTATLQANTINIGSGSSNSGTITATASSMAQYTGTQSTFTVGGTNIMNIYQDKIQINGNLEIAGTIDSINTTSVDLMVQDNHITLAHNSNGALPIKDGFTTNHTAGIIVDGTPATPVANVIPGDLTELEMKTLYEKSLKWNFKDPLATTALPQNGMGGLGGSNVDAESFWELKGGGLRITNSKPKFKADGTYDGSDIVSFGFRINQYDEFELVKRYTNKSTKLGVPIGTIMYKKIAKFGRILY